MNALQELGLSSYEEQAYRTLVATGPASARTVAERGSVPRGRVYDVLNGLEGRGLVWTLSGDPQRYAALDPVAAVDRLLEDRLAELDARAERYRRIAADARSSFAPTPPVDGQFWLADLGTEDARTVIQEGMTAAEDCFVAAIGPPYTGAPVESYETEYAAFLDHLSSELTVQLLVDDTMVDALSPFVDALDTATAEADVRQFDGIDATFAVVDGAETYIDIPHPTRTGTRFGFIEFRDETVADQLGSLFEEVWAAASPVTATARE